ncbi:ATP synthase F1 subunit delta [Tunturiibacter gelidoferens]|uniref:F-type H+-transporting ATPase subunit delta n=1 Tax=Tunturiibacter gelidiferens TaxID=3069689 RepID=A0ACC5NY00_9BACT|nr:ATP synthase F1 subunit delta [Edaphobacter lichenicola]MBB5339469.1 F-type H+-transporting ATPase subunit delta [Edaphobacter lichenicola]
MSVLSLRYAHAFASVAASAHLNAAAAQQQLGDFSGTLAGSHDLREVLMNPSIANEQKLKVLDAIASRIGMFPQVRNFIAVIMDHQRLDELDEILNEYHVLADEQSNVAEAEITSARPLNDQDRAELEAQVAKLAGGRVRATYHQDATLLGGAVVRLGSTVYDGSIRGQLQQLKQKLVNA